MAFDSSPGALAVSAAQLSREAKREILAGCRAIIGGEYDPLRAVWDEQATAKDRRLLLAMAGHAGSMTARLASRAWCDLLPETRVAVAGGLRRFKAWAERLQ